MTTKIKMKKNTTKISRRCEREKCREKATSFIRTKKVCSRCFSIVKKDNKRRIKEGIEIPESFEELEEKPSRGRRIDSFEKIKIIKRMNWDDNI